MLAITFKDGGTQKLWIGKRDLLIYRSEWDPSMKPMKGMMGAYQEAARSEAGSADGSDARERMMAQAAMDQMQNMSMSITTTYRDMKLNAGIDEAQFVFEPGKGEKVVDASEYAAGST